jgi:hypothetical protein
MTTYDAGPSPEQEVLQPQVNGASQRYHETREKADRATEARDNAYRKNPTPEEAAEYKRLDDASRNAWDHAAAAEEALLALNRRFDEATMKKWMIQYQAELTAKAVSKVLRAEMGWIKILLFVLVVLVLLATYEAHMLPSWLSK